MATALRTTAARAAATPADATTRPGYNTWMSAAVRWLFITLSLAFLGNERIVCAVLDNGLQPGLDRYFPYRAIVAGAPHPFYVFRQGSPQSILFEQAAAAQHISYTRSLVDGYVIYDPGSRVAT